MSEIIKDFGPPTWPKDLGQRSELVHWTVSAPARGVWAPEILDSEGSVVTNKVRGVTDSSGRLHVCHYHRDETGLTLRAKFVRSLPVLVWEITDWLLGNCSDPYEMPDALEVDKMVKELGIRGPADVD